MFSSGQTILNLSRWASLVETIAVPETYRQLSADSVSDLEGVRIQLGRVLNGLESIEAGAAAIAVRIADSNPINIASGCACLRQALEGPPSAVPACWRLNTIIGNGSSRGR